MQSRIEIRPRMSRFRIFLLALLATGLVLCGSITNSWSQENPFGSPNFGMPQSVSPVSLSAYFKTDQGGLTGRLSVRADIEDHWHVYSITQPKNGPLPTVITVKRSDGFVLTGEFEPNANPIIKLKSDFPVPQEEHEFGVIWSAPIGISPGGNLSDLKIEVEVKGQSCITNEDGSTGTCVQFKKNLIAAWEGELAVARSNIKFKPRSGHALWLGSVKPGAARPGEKVVVELTAIPFDNYHIYDLDGGQEAKLGGPTHIVFSKNNGWESSKATAVGARQTASGEANPLPYYSDEVTWRFEVRIPKNQQPGETSLGGSIGYQTCIDAMSDQHSTVDFSVPITVTIGDVTSDEPAIISFSDSSLSYAKVVDLVAKYAVSGQRSAGQWSGYSLPRKCTFAWAGVATVRSRSS